MGMSFKEILNRYNFFSSNDEEPSPNSITSPIQRDYASDQNYDVNFEQTLREKFADDSTAVGFGSMNYITWLSQAEHSKDTRTQQYREMEQNGYVSAGLDEIVYSAINEDEHGESIKLNIKNKGFEDNDNIRENLYREFKHTKDSILKYDENFTTMFREFVLMGEIALEYLVPHDNEEIRTKGIQGIKMLLSEEFVPIYTAEGKIDGFVVKNPWDASTRLLASNKQFAYVDSGKYDYVDGNGPTWAKQYIPNQSQNKVLRLVRSFMEEARKPYKQLDALEDSLVIFRLSRAPSRLIFNVATGNLPKNRAEQYLQKIMNKYRKKLTYNAETGSVDQAQNVKNIMEDYWFVKDNQGKGTDVTSLAGGENLGEIEDVNFFLSKLYRAMKVPLARITGESTFEQSVGMNREEIKFEKYIYWIVQKFVKVVKQVYKTQLQLKGIWDHYQMKDEDFEIIATPPSYFSYMKNSEVLEAQFTRFANFSNNIDQEEPIFAKRMALKEGLGWSDEKIQQNKKWLDEEKAAAGGEEGEEGGEMGGGLGGDEDVGGGEEGGEGDLGL